MVSISSITLIVSCTFILIANALEEYEEEPNLEDTQKFPGGFFWMGTTDQRYHHNGEHPIRKEYTKAFKMDRYPVTNAQFEQFVRNTRYVRTEADSKQYSYVFFSHVAPESRQVTAAILNREPWWLPVQHTRWDRPYGPLSSISGREKYPAVHVSLVDAASFCAWKGKRLPTEFEWEYAIRANNKTWIYPWGDHYRKRRMNLWQGFFPTDDAAVDGYDGLSPVDAFPAQNQVGMHDMLGNVWEWTSTQYYGTDKPQDRKLWILRGGSFIDNLEGDVNALVRCSVKTGRESNFTAENVGFRCAETIIPVKPKSTPRIILLEDTWQYKQEVKKLSGKYSKLYEKTKQAASLLNIDTIVKREEL